MGRRQGIFPKQYPCRSQGALSRKVRQLTSPQTTRPNFPSVLEEMQCWYTNCTLHSTLPLQVSQYYLHNFCRNASLPKLCNFLHNIASPPQKFQIFREFSNYLLQKDKRVLPGNGQNRKYSVSASRVYGLSRHSCSSSLSYFFFPSSLLCLASHS